MPVMRYDPSKRHWGEYEQRITLRLPTDLYDYLVHLGKHWNEEVGFLMPVEEEELTVSEVVRKLIQLFRTLRPSLEEWALGERARQGARQLVGGWQDNPDLVAESALVRVSLPTLERLKELQALWGCPNLGAVVETLVEER